MEACEGIGRVAGASYILAHTEERTWTVSFFIGISYVTGLSFTRKALDSLGVYSGKVVLVDCADNGPTIFGTSAMERKPVIIRPTVPLFHTQFHNLCRKMALDGYSVEANLYGATHNPYYFVMHNDAEASPETVRGLINLHSQMKSLGRKVGVIYTNYDALALYDTQCAKEVGPWDDRLTSYYSDNDYYRRVKLAGWELMDSGLPVTHYGSHVIKIDPVRKWLNHNVVFELYRQYYIAKWGGDPDKEKFTKPFDGQLEHFDPDYTEHHD